MALYLIGLGLGTEKDITLHGLEAVKKCSKLYIETYTSQLGCSKEVLEQFYGKPLISADRTLVESHAEETILKDAEQEDVAFLVVGDVFGATTHTDLMLRAKEKNIPVTVINNVSIINAVANTGLELYKFGKTTSIVFPEKNHQPESFYDVIAQNKSIGAHTLCLLDIKMEQGSERFMTINDALNILLDIEKKRKQDIVTEKTFVVGCARMGHEDAVIKYGSVEELMKHNFGKPLHCLIIPGPLHFKEEEMLKVLNNE
ncbi:MAG: diphthine synthase [Candidatus Woesearchaeota archaeon]|nr:diphthine synthase [Candidatus Woesearchaeota archaeon]